MKWIHAIGLMLFSAASVAADMPPDQLVKQVSEEVRLIIKQDKDIQSGSTSKISLLVEEKVFPHVNFSRTTQLAVGKNWREATQQQKDALIKEFRSLLVRTYATSLAQFRDQAIEYTPVKLAPSDTTVVVNTNVVQQGRESIGIDYSMQKTDRGWKVYDITVEGVSLVTTYRGEFNERIRQGGIDGLIKALSEKNKAAS